MRRSRSISARLLRSSSLAIFLFVAWAVPAHGAVVAGGRSHTAVVLPDGTVWTWGSNEYGQLGDGTGVPSRTPAPVPGLANVVSVASGDDHVLALTSDGSVWAWGRNDFGQAGHGSTANQPLPVLVMSGVLSVDAGPDYSIARTLSGEVWAWGRNASGQLGDGTTVDRTDPAPILGLMAAQVSAGHGHVLARDGSGQVWAWGANGAGQLGNGTLDPSFAPIEVPDLANKSVVSAGAQASYVIDGLGNLYAWGANNFGQLGDGTTVDRLAPVGIGPAQGVETGDGHALALLSGGQLGAWGRNDRGQVGDGTTTSRLSPVTLGLTDIVAAGAGTEHSVAVTADGVVWTWGHNAAGQLGDGTTEDRLIPVAISGPGFSWKVGRPVLSPPGGTYEASQTVTLTSVTAGASLLYTIDGSEPSVASPALPSGGTLTVDESKTIQALAFKTGQTPSDPVSATYTLKVPAVVFSPPAGTYPEPQIVTLQSGSGAEVRYTLDGSEPSASSTLYAPPLVVGQPATVKARAFKTGWDASGISSAEYVIHATLPVEWMDLAGVTADGSSLRKASGSVWAWDSGAVSTKAIASGAGWAETVVLDTYAYWVFGLSHGNAGQGLADVDYGFYKWGQSLYVYEGGVQRASLGAPVQGDRLRVVVEDGVVKYLRNGQVRYVSGTTATYPLLVDTSLHNPGALLSNVTISGVLTDVVLEPPGIPVEWTDLAGVTADGSSLRKASGSVWAWDSGAVSTKAIASGAGWAEMVVLDTYAYWVFGLSHGNAGQGLADVDYGFYKWGQSLYVYEGGVQRASLGAPVQGDRLRVVVEDGVVKYLRNGQVRYVSGTTATYPLLVDTSLHNPGALLSNVTISGVLTDVVLEPPGIPVEWTDLAGVTAEGSSLRKASGSVWAWDSGAVSTKAIASGAGWAETVVLDTYAYWVFGLSHGNAGQGLADVDYGFYKWGQSLYVYEGGVQRASLGAPVQGDRLRVVVEDGVVKYLRNGQVRYVSGVPPTYPLLVDTSLHSPGALLSNVTISGVLTDVVLEPPGIPVEWTDLAGVTAEGSSLRKASGSVWAWDSGAVSTKAIASGAGWAETVVLDTYAYWVFGLSHGNAGQGLADVDYGFYKWGQSLYVYEGGVQRASLGAPVQGDRLRVVVEDGVVKYLRNGQVRYVSGTTATYPLLVDTSLHNPGALLSNVTISGVLTDVVLEPPGIPVEWTDLAGVTAEGSSLRKASGSVWAWDSGAVSTKAIASGAGWAETVVLDTYAYWVFGLSHGNAGQGLADVDYGFYKWGQSLYVYEGGVQRASLGAPVQGDRLRVVVEDGVVKYLRNGQVRYVSGTTATYPLLVDTSLHNPGALLSNVTISGVLTDVVLEPPGIPVEWTDLAGVTAEGSSLRKASGSVWAWDSGAVSTKAIASGAGWAETVVLDTYAYWVFGLSHGNAGQGLADVDYGFYKWGQSLYVYEGGVQRASLGAPVQGDRLRVVVEDGVVKYLRNGQVRYVSGTTATYPLLVDTSLHNPGALLSNVTISGDDLQNIETEPPLLSPPGGSFSSPVSVGLVPVTPGSTIRYTLDGSDPTPLSATYTGPLAIATTTDLRARAFKAGWQPSPVVGAFYQFEYGTLPPTTLTPPGGTYVSTVAVSLQGPPGAAIYYSTDGSPPSSPYSGPIALTATTTLKAHARRADWTTSPITQATYEIQVAAPIFDPPAGHYPAPQDVAITTATPDATITYTTNGNEPTPTDQFLAVGETVHVDQTMTLRAKAWKTGTTPSDTAEAGYTIDVRLGMVAAGESFSLALDRDGQVWAWGSNEEGQIGNGTTEVAASPSLVGGLGRAKAVAAGSTHVLALAEDGTVWAWGSNRSGQLGDGTTTSRSAPARVNGITDVVAVAAGFVSSLALGRDGTVWAWGNNSEGQLGDGTWEDRSAPMAVPGLSGVVSIGAGSWHSLALKGDTTVWAWGDNSLGALGTSASSPSPQVVPGLAGITAIATGSSASHNVAWAVDGTAWTWGFNRWGQLGQGTIGESAPHATLTVPTSVAGASLGGGHTLFLTADGQVWSVGANTEGQLGDGTATDRSTAAQVAGITEVVSVAAGSAQSLALTRDGTIYAWGANHAGQLGDGATNSALEPVAISGPGFQWKVATPVFSPAPGGYTSAQTVVMTCATPGATIHYTTSGADPTESDAAIASGESVEMSEPLTLKARAFLAGRPPSNVATAAYSIKAVAPVADPPGGGYTGAQSVTLTTETAAAEIRYTTDGSEPSLSSALYIDPIAIQATTLLKAKAFREGLDASDTATVVYSIGPRASLAAGAFQSFALQDRVLWAWGSNAFGQLGDGTTTTRPLPVAISSLGDVVAVSTGENHALALRADATVWAWGNNDNGRLGLGTNDSQTAPQQVPGLSDVIAVSAGTWHSLALKADGTVWGWGGNWTGQLGDGTQDGRWSPVIVSGLSGVKAIAAGWQHSVALGADGAVWAWGNSEWGQVGDGTLDSSLVPKAVILPGAVDRIALGSAASHTFAHTTDGRWWGWGLNEVGQLGIGTTDPQLTPVEVPLFADMTAVSPDGMHTLALKSDGTVWATGWNSAGQLGDGTNEDRREPVRVGALEGIVEVEAGWYHGLARAADSTIYAWGANGDAQLGDGTFETHLEPTPISGPDFAWKTATPTASSASGSYTTDLAVTLQTVTPGAVIHYTLDGPAPTVADPVASGPLSIDRNRELRAGAFAAGKPPSNTALFVYRLSPVPPSLSPPGGEYASAQTVSISTETPGAEIRYTLDGSEPTAVSTAYTGPLAIATATQLRARAFKAGWGPGEAVEALYTFAYTVGPPIISPPGGTYVASVEVTLEGPPGGTLLYSTDGGAPSLLYTGPLTLTETATVRAQAIRSDSVSSEIVESTYTITGHHPGTVATPSIVPAGGTFSEPVLATMSCATAGATIRYTTDGTAPTSGSPIYSSALTVLPPATVRAKAFLADFNASSTATAQYLSGADVPAPRFSRQSGTYPAGFAVQVTVETSGAQIHYTTSGIDPTDSDPTIASGGTLMVSRSMTLKARAFKTGLTPSPVRRADYILTGALSSGPQGSHSLLLKEDGTVWAWGYNGAGQLGDGTRTSRSSPVQVVGLTNVVAVAAGTYFSLALKNDGTIWSWGSNQNGEGANGFWPDTTLPVKIPDFGNVVGIAAGDNHSLAVKADGSVWAWGLNYQNQVGSQADLLPVWSPTHVPGLIGVTAVAAGGAFSFALQTEGEAAGTVWAWGQNTNGQLGNGSTTGTGVPTKVGLAANITAVDGGLAHAVALDADGVVWAWGSNERGQLGDATWGTERPVPVRSRLPNAISVSAGQAHTMALTRDGSVWNWGRNENGALGDGSSSDRTTPVRPIGMTDAVAISAGANFSLAIRRDGTVWGWGTNANFQIGDGDLNDRHEPVPSSGLSSGDNSWLAEDPDHDGLANGLEQALGSDPANPDTNGDGVSDGAAYAAGLSLTNLDMDGDGVPNRLERERGTDPFRADTDGDGVSDGTDCFPLDPARSTCPPPVPGDHTPPIIILEEPTSAVLVSSVP